jgi:Zn-dependent peptidase ImmA (M78 family)
MIKLPDYRYEELKKIVVSTFIKTGVRCIPVNGFEIASKLGVAICAYSSLSPDKRAKAYEIDPDGFVAYTDQRWFIYYDDTKCFSRINNTIMHEIWHVVLDHKETSEVAEAEAKFCAKYSMAPPVLVHKYKAYTTELIQEYFQVSYEASVYALSYYHKWLRYGECDYTDYEEVLYNMIELAT